MRRYGFHAEQGAFQFAQDIASLLDEGLSRDSEFHLPGGSLEEADTERDLEFLDATGLTAKC